MSYIDVKYLNLISPQLQQFKKKGDALWNFRCPYCGDSQKSRTKARGFVFRKKNDLFYKCHNCGVGASLGNLLKTVDSKTYKDYIFERYRKGVKTNNPEPEFHFNAPVFRKKGILKGLKSIQDLPKEHPARCIVEKRRLPPESLSDIYLCETFYKFTNSVIPNKFPSLDGDHPRLLIPFRNEDGEVFAYQGRAFGDEQPKYVTIKLDENKRKIYGLERVNLTQHINIVEGPIDSLFVDNCLAMGGADMFFDRVPSEQVTYIFDNEPRNKEIIKRMYDVINKGYNLVVWPDDMRHKDINDMILGKLAISEINDIISTNTCSKLEALTKLNNWKKI